MKSQDLIEDSSKIPKGSQDQSGFSLYRTLFIKKSKKTPCGCNFCFIVFWSGSKHERKSYSYFSVLSFIFIIWAKIRM